MATLYNVSELLAVGIVPNYGALGYLMKEKQWLDEREFDKEMFEGIGFGLVSLNMKDVLSSQLFTIFRNWLAWKGQFLPMSVVLPRKSKHHTTES